MRFAVNGTLMRGFDLNPRMIEAGASFLREAKTAPVYRLWSIGDEYPGMLRVVEGGCAIALELWDISAEGLVSILQNEPAGLTVGKVELDDGSTVPGVLAEPYIVEGCLEISEFGGWRAYPGSQKAPADG